MENIRKRNLAVAFCTGTLGMKRFAISRVAELYEEEKIDSLLSVGGIERSEDHTDNLIGGIPDKNRYEVGDSFDDIRIFFYHHWEEIENVYWVDTGDNLHRLQQPLPRNSQEMGLEKLKLHFIPSGYEGRTWRLLFRVLRFLRTKYA